MTNNGFYQHAYHFCSSDLGLLRFLEALRHTAYEPGKPRNAKVYFLTDPNN